MLLLVPLKLARTLALLRAPTCDPPAPLPAVADAVVDSEAAAGSMDFTRHDMSQLVEPSRAVGGRPWAGLVHCTQASRVRGVDLRDFTHKDRPSFPRDGHGLEQ